MVRAACASVAFGLLAIPVPAAAPAPDDSVIRQLNDDYVRAFMACDVGRFRSLLADDFQGVLADGRVIGKVDFLAMAASPPDVRDLRLHEVSIRQFGDCAVVTARVAYRRASGAEVQTRYCDVLARRDGRWQIEWVQWTRVASP